MGKKENHDWLVRKETEILKGTIISYELALQMIMNRFLEHDNDTVNSIVMFRIADKALKENQETR